VGHGGEESIDELEVWSVEGDGALQVDKLGYLGSSGLADGRVAADCQLIISYDTSLSSM
jgi:hypothetical protein